MKVDDFKNLTISIGCDNTQKLLESLFWDYEVNREATASTYTLPYDNKTDYIIHINEKVLKWSYAGIAAVSAHEAYHYCLSNYPTEDEEYFAYKIEDVVGKIVYQITTIKEKTKQG